MCTTHVELPPAHVHFLLIMPLPLGLFFLLASRKQTSSPSRQMIVCSRDAPAAVGSSLQRGNACNTVCASWRLAYTKVQCQPPMVALGGRHTILTKAWHISFLHCCFLQLWPCFRHMPYKGKAINDQNDTSIENHLLMKCLMRAWYIPRFAIAIIDLLMAGCPTCGASQPIAWHAPRK